MIFTGTPETGRSNFSFHCTTKSEHPLITIVIPRTVKPDPRCQFEVPGPKGASPLHLQDVDSARPRVIGFGLAQGLARRYLLPEATKSSLTSFENAASLSPSTRRENR